MQEKEIKRRLESVVELLAAIEHERWSHWQKYLHGKCIRGDNGSLIIPADLAYRWAQQSATRYADLSDEEKESDREQVRGYLPVIERAFSDLV
jgi:hypothetical protein